MSAMQSKSRMTFNRERSYRLILWLLCTLVSTTLTDVADAGRPDWKAMTSVADVVASQPEAVASLMRALDLDRPGLETVRSAWQTGDSVAACEALLAYYRQREQPAWFRNAKPEAAPDAAKIAEADDLVNDVFHGFGDRGRVPRDAAGRLDWTHRGPNRDLQFACRVNRHHFLNTLLCAYETAGERRYLSRLDEDLSDWLLAADGHPAPKGFGHGPLEAALRMPVWTTVFFRLQDKSELRPATRLLLLAAIPAHADYLRETVRRRHNFATMQMSGLGTLGLAFPEFQQADRWWEFARDVMVQEVRNQTYPDGAQIELAFSYHLVSLRCFGDLLAKADAAGKPPGSAYRDRIETMWGYVADVLRPDGTGPLSGDTDLRDWSEALVEAAERFNQPSWRYVATAGEAGDRPAGPPSRFLPWAGQLITRSGWDHNAMWGFFDVGPYGHGGHGHPDKLHLSVYAFGRHLLVDTGRFAYQGHLAEKFRARYMWHSRSHNVVLIDGQSQGKGQQVAQSPIDESSWTIANDHDWAIGEMDNYRSLAGRARHRRALCYQRGKFWVVVDRVETDRPRTIRALWHFHPNCTVRRDEDVVLTTDPQANVRIVPAARLTWQASLARGQEEHELMGWYSPNYGTAVPTTVASYEAPINAGVTTFAWLILPAAGEVPPAKVELMDVDQERVELELRIEDGPPRHLIVPMQR
jgi:hypothetical protein